MVAEAHECRVKYILQPWVCEIVWALLINFAMAGTAATSFRKKREKKGTWRKGIFKETKAVPHLAFLF